MTKLYNIAELTKILNQGSKTEEKTYNHTIRYWEKEFSQIKPKLFNNRRYYDLKQIEIIKLIKFLLKEKGMTIKGAKNALNTNYKKLDDYKSHSLKADYYKKNINIKTKTLLEKIKKLKKYGKKNSH
tara:strand:+ start:15153 stop:15533 length:381 start_codon:yes stop_codon:yes gene_type:complete